MQDPKSKLTIFHDDNSVFAEGSDELLDYGRDSFAVELVSAEDRFYVGFEKPVNALYFELATANTNSNTFTAQYYNGTAFSSLAGFQDDTKGWTRSGFFHWGRDQEDEAKTTINGVELFWYRFTPSADHSAGTVLKGLNFVFADDEDLRGEVPEIDSFRNDSESSFILVHQSVRNEIVQEIRNKGRRKQTLNPSGGRDFNNITQWDFLDRFELRVAAKYLALSKIFFNVSDAPEDKERQKSIDYSEKFTDAFDLFWLSLDEDDDGLIDRNERLQATVVNVTRR